MDVGGEHTKHTKHFLEVTHLGSKVESDRGEVVGLPECQTTKHEFSGRGEETSLQLGTKATIASLHQKVLKEILTNDVDRVHYILRIDQSKPIASDRNHARRHGI